MSIRQSASVRKSFNCFSKCHQALASRRYQNGGNLLYRGSMIHHHHNQKLSPNLQPDLYQQQSSNITMDIRSESYDEAQYNVALLYRRFLKALPWVRENYHVPAELYEMRKRLKHEFKSYQNVREIELIDALVLRGYQEYEETLYHHKQRAHILRFFSENQMEPLRTQVPDQKRITKEKVDVEQIVSTFKPKRMGKQLSKALKNYRE